MRLDLGQRPAKGNYESTASTAGISGRRLKIDNQKLVNGNFGPMGSARAWLIYQ
jgi:hypothetical protein